MLGLTRNGRLNGVWGRGGRMVRLVLLMVMLFNSFVPAAVPQAAAQTTDCAPISTLPCEQIGVDLPFSLTFDGTEGGLTTAGGIGTGFTMVDPPSARLAADLAPFDAAVPGYEPGRLTVSGSRLTIATNKGIAYLNPPPTGASNVPGDTSDETNSQINALGVGVPVGSTTLELQTRITAPTNFSGQTSSSQQGGVWFGLDEDNYVKLAFVNNNGSGQMNLLFESGSNAPTAQDLKSGNISLPTTGNSVVTSVDLKLTINRATQQATGQYVLNRSGAAATTGSLGPLSIAPVASAPSIVNGTSIGGNDPQIYAGLFATHRRANTSLNFAFDTFTVAEVVPAPAAPTGLSAVSGDGQVSLSWNSASGATGYTIYRRGVNETSFGAPLATVSGTSYVDTTAANGVIYSYAVAASNSGGASANSALAQAMPDVSEPVAIDPTNGLAFNFQPQDNSPAVSGYIRDYGMNYANIRGYGWTTPAGAPLNLVGNARDRNLVTDQLRDTLLHMQANTIPGAFTGIKAEGAWRVALPNGQYSVEVGVGDPSVDGNVSDTPTHRITVEDTVAIAGFVPTGLAGTSTRSTSATVVVAVSDGFLNVSAAGGFNTKINFITIAPFVATPTPETPTPETPTPETPTPETPTPETPTPETPTPETPTPETPTPETPTPETPTPETPTPETPTPETPTPEPLPAPTGLTATAGNGSVTLAWSAVSGAAEYYVYRGPSSNPANANQIATVATTGYVDATAVNGTQYYYWITAVDAAAVQSAISNSANATPTAPPAGCSPISTLPCAEVGVSVPFALTFDGTEGGLAAGSGGTTGFTMVDPPSARLAADAPVSNTNVPGYEPGRLAIDNGDLVVTSTKGIQFRDPATSNNTNSQLNALGVGVDVDGTVRISTTIVNPAFNASSGTEAQQAGIWFGLNENNYIKLVVGKTNTTGARVQMVLENYGTATTSTTLPAEINTANDVILNPQNQTITLILEINATTGTARGFYQVGSGAETALLSIGNSSSSLPPGTTTMTLPAAFLAGLNHDGDAATAPLSYAGIFTTHRNAAADQSIPFRFANFAIAPVAPPVTPTPTTPTVEPTTPTVEPTTPTVEPTTPTVEPTTPTVEPTTPTVEPTTPTPDALTVRVNFQNQGAPVPDGYLRDYGLPYGARSAADTVNNGPAGLNLVYGWLNESTLQPLNISVGGNTPGNGRDRNVLATGVAAAQSANLAQRTDTLMHMQADDIHDPAAGRNFNGTPTNGLWEIALPNGAYTVTVGVGDPNVDGLVIDTPSYVINAEGVRLIGPFTPTGGVAAPGRFATGSAVVSVSDGKLTIDALGGYNTKINYIEIVASTETPVTPTPETPTPETPTPETPTPETPTPETPTPETPTPETPTAEPSETATATPTPVVACTPISTLGCAAIVPSLPVALTFDGTEGGLANTGFTMVDPPSARLAGDGAPSNPAVPGFEPGLLSLSGGNLTIASTKGIQYLKPEGTAPISAGTNSLLNALGVGVSANGAILRLETTLLKPAFPATAQAQQGGLWFGLNEDNYVKLVLSNGGNGAVFVQMLREVNAFSDNSTANDVGTDNFALTNGAPITLVMEIDSVTGVVRGFYQVGNGALTPVTDTGVSSIALPPAFTSGVNHDGDAATGPISYAGIFATSRNGATGLPVTFSSFSLSQTGGTTPTPTASPTPATPTPSPTPAPSTFAIKVNFQNAAAPVPTGYVRDYGQPYGARTAADQGSGLTYGWVVPGTNQPLDLSVGGTLGPGNGRDRNVASDQRLDTLMHMQATDVEGTFNGTKLDGMWEIAVPNGTYSVTLAVGDPSVGQDPEAHSIYLEGVNVLNRFVPSGAAGSATRFSTVTAEVTVTDGKLTVAAEQGVAATDGTNTKINYIDITSVALTPPDTTPPPAPSNVSATPGNSQVALAWDPVVADDLAGYQIYRDTQLPVNVTGAPLTPALISTVSYVDQTPDNGISYYYVIVAVDTSGNKAYAPEVLAIPNGALPRPQVVAVRPANSETGVDLNEGIATDLFLPNGGIEFSTLTGNVRLVKVSTGVEVPANLGTSGGFDVIVLQPQNALEPNTQYRFEVGGGATDQAGMSFIPFSSSFTTGSPSGPISTNIEFDKLRVNASNDNDKHTSLVIGPDNRLYASTDRGVIKRWDIASDGTLINPPLYINTVVSNKGNRLLIGMAFDPASTANNLILWVSHGDVSQSNAAEWSSTISRLSGPNLATYQDYVVNLPRSGKDHAANSLAFGPDGALYLILGSNSAMGAPDSSWLWRPERLLSAAVLRIDTDAISPNAPLDAKTEQGGTYNPFAPGAPVTIYARGIRNAYDIVWHSNGFLYSPANGSAAGGNAPQTPENFDPATCSTRPDGGYTGSQVGTNSSNTPSGAYSAPTSQNSFVPGYRVGNTQHDWLFKVVKDGYYGHPNPTRCEWVLNGGNPTAFNDGPAEVPSYAVGTLADPNYRGWAYDFGLNKSPNGVIEYQSNTFGGALRGSLLVVRFSQNDDIMVLRPNATNGDIGAATPGSDIPGFSGFVDPLDLVEDTRNGNIYVSEYAWNTSSGQKITLLRPRTAAGAPSINVPATRLIFSGPTGSPTATQAVTVQNNGTAPLNLSAATITGAGSSQFQISSGGGAVSVPVSGVATINVVFSPTSAGVKVATLNIPSNDPLKPLVQVELRGLAAAGLGGSNEPSLQWILDTFNIPVNVGDDNPATNIVHSSTFTAPLLGEEVAIQRFVKAGPGSVTIEPLAVYGPTNVDPIVTFGWYQAGNANGINALFAVTNSPASNGQRLNPPLSASSTTTFDPGDAVFGFYSRWPFFQNRTLYSEDSLNTFSGAIPHHVRVYPLKNADGSVVPNAYIVATEEHISGFDFQDVVVIVRNVAPAPESAPQASAAPAELVFSAVVNTTSLPAPQVVTVTNSGSAALTISGVSISGANANTFSLVNPPSFPLSVPAGQSAQFNVVFSPTSVGALSAALNIASDDEQNPVTQVGLYGLGLQGLEGGNEPAFQNVVNTLGYAINVGWSGLTNDSPATGPQLEGDEVAVPLFEKAGIGPVTMTPVARFSPSEDLPYGFYTLNAGNPVLSQVGVMAPRNSGLYPTDNHQRLYPLVVAGSNAGFDPGNAAFGIYVDSNTFNRTSFTQDALNVGSNRAERAARVYPLKDREGNLVPNAYLVGFEDATNGDYQDYVFVLRNVRPAGTGGETPGEGISLNFNFQPATAAVPPGYIADAGLGYGARNGQTYGWISPTTGQPLDLSAQTRLRTSNSDQRLNSLIIAEPGGNNTSLLRGVWEVAVPNGIYEVTVSVGDPDFTDSSHSVSVEGVAAITGFVPGGAAGSAARHTQATVLVTVNDGKLTLTPNGDQTKVNFVEIVGGTTSGGPALTERVNFQPAGAATPTDYTADTGEGYSATRGFGWATIATANSATPAPVNMTLNTRERDAISDQRLDTLVLMQGTGAANQPGTGAWLYDLPNGTYDVTVAVGDPSFVDSVHQLTIEGVNAFATPFTPTAANPFATATVTVNVTDGQLTLIPTGTNTKLAYVEIIGEDTGTGEPDTTPPTVAVSVSGLLQTVGVYRNQATVTVSAGDTGGSGLASVSYSVNGGNFQPYSVPVNFTEEGNYSVTARAVDRAGNITTSPATTFSVVIPPPSKARIAIENLDKVPYNDRLVMSRIGSSLTPNLPSGNQVKDTAVLRITNTGADPLTITGLNISTASFVLDTPPAFPLIVPVGGQTDVTVRFVAVNNGTGNGLHQANLTIVSDDPTQPQVVVQLAGFWQSVSEGGQEPDFTELLNLFGYSTFVKAADGVTGAAVFTEQPTSPLTGDEVRSNFWTRADVTKPVYVRQLAAYHGCCTAADSFSLSGSGGGSMSHAGAYGQSILPLKSGAAGGPAELTLNPTSATFTLNSAGYSTNTTGNLGIRMFPVRDRDGVLIPNTYYMLQDFVQSGCGAGSANCDYNDNVYLVTNVKPAGTNAPPNPSAGAALPGAPSLTREFSASVPGTLLSGNGVGTGFSSTQTNKNDVTPGGASYQPALINVNTANGTLTLTSGEGNNIGANGTNANALNNTHVNYLQNSFDAAAGPFTVSARLLGPLDAINAGAEEAGIFFGNDRNNFVKLAVVNSNGTPVIQLRSERGLVSLTNPVHGATVPVPSPTTIQSLDLFLTGDPATGLVTAAYSVNGGPITPMAGSTTITGNLYGRFFGANTKAGILASHRGGAQFTATFDRFAVTAGDPQAGPPPVSGTAEALYRLNVAGVGNYTDTLGNVWTPDTGFFTPTNAINENPGNSDAILNTDDDPIYRSYRGNVNTSVQANRFITYNLPTRGATVVDLRLHFAERFGGNNAVGSRVFDIEAEGKVIRSGFDIFAAAGAVNTAVILPLNDIQVTDGVLTLVLRASADYPAISGIEVLCQGACPAPDTTPPAAPTALTAAVNGATVALDWANNSENDLTGYFVYRAANPAGPFTLLNAQPVLASAYTDSNVPSGTFYYQVAALDTSGNISAPSAQATATVAAQPIRINTGGTAQTVGGVTWQGCTGNANTNPAGVNCGGYVTGGFAYSEAGDTNTGIPAGMNNAIFTSEWTGSAASGPAFTFNVPVGSGQYNIRLHFAELNKFAAGTRVFDVAIEGTTVLTNFDVFAQAGGANIAIVREFPVTVLDGAATIAFFAKVENAKISAIEIIPTGPVPTATPTPITPTPETPTPETPTVEPTTPTAAPGGSVVARINAGGPAVNIGGVSWSADTFFSGGKTYTNPSVTAIAGTTDDVLYLTERSATSNLGSFSYAIPVPASGSYLVRLHFAEIYWGATGGGTLGTNQRVFSANLEGGPVELANFNINAAVGPMTATVQEFTIPVTDGTLNIAFTASVDQPKVSAIEVLTTGSTTPTPETPTPETPTPETPTPETPTPETPTPETPTPETPTATTPTPETPTATTPTVAPGSSTVRINTGGTAQTVNGVSWQGCASVGGCNGYVTGGFAYSEPGDTNTGIPAGMNNTIFTSEWTGIAANGPAFTFNVPVSNGGYVVKLHFAELNKFAAGARVFDVAIEGTTVLSNFDVFAQAGGANSAIVREFPVTVNDGTVTIAFFSKVQYAKISAIEIVPAAVVAPTATTPTPETPTPITPTPETPTATTPTPITPTPETPTATTPTPITPTPETPTATTPTPETPTTTPGPKTALFVVSGTSASGFDATVLSRLESLGFVVTVKSQTAAVAADANGKDLVVISSSVTASTVGNKFTGVAVPLLTWEYALYTTLGMATSQAQTAGQTQIAITAAGHPLAAGFTGNVAVRTASFAVPVGVPNSNAIKVASLPNNAAQSPYFAYEAGAAMPGLAAPARRVAFPFNTTGSGAPTASAWTLFDAAVLWAAGSNAGAPPTATGTATTPTATTPTPAPGGSVVARINAGGPAVNIGGVSWSADTFFSGGKSYNNANVTAIAGTTDDVLYQTERSATSNLGSFSYAIPVPASGEYLVRLHFAEIWFIGTGGGPAGTGNRIFSANLEGGPVELANFDINAAVGPLTATVQEFIIPVTDGTLNIAFMASVNQPKISAIEVLTTGSTTPTATTPTPETPTATTPTPETPTATTPTPETPTATTPTPETPTATTPTATVAPGGTTVRINTGGTAQTVGGVTWQGCTSLSACNGYVTGGFVHSEPGDTNTGIPAGMNNTIFTSEWTGGQSNGVPVGGTAFTFTVPVTNGGYVVRLHFAELNKFAAGLRLFDVNVENGQGTLSNFDIFAAAGGANIAIVREFPITVNDGNVSIVFTRQLENAKISAIEILPAGANGPTPTPAPPSAPADTWTEIAWSNAAGQPFSNSEAQGAVVNGKLYTFGGFDSTKSCCTPTERAFVYDPTANTWSAIAPLPFLAGNGQTGGGVTHAGVASDGTYIYLAGGYIASSPGSGQVFGTNQVWRYDPATNSYTRLANLPAARAAGILYVLNGNLHYVAGTNVQRTQDVADHYMITLSSAINQSATWSTLASLPNPRQHAAGVTLNGKLYYIGGQKGHDGALIPQSDVHVYDPVANSWSQVAGLPQGRNHHGNSTFVFGGRIIVLGGQGNHTQTLSTSALAYNPDTNQWTPLTNMPQARHSGVGAAIGNALYFTTGGFSGMYKGLPSGGASLLFDEPADAPYKVFLPAIFK